ncbi:MAG: sulfite exporter TauE/SafE family protein [Hyphomicrobiaceae bacterium]
MLDPQTLIVVAATFLLAGTVKGVIGLGLPSVSLGILTAAIDLPTAMALLLAPSFVTNLWQGVVGGNLREILTRAWPFLLAATLTIPIGALALSRLNLSWLAALLGVLLALYSGLSLAGYRASIAPESEKWSGPLFGITNGVLTGMTGSFVVPGVMYLQAIGLPRDILVQAMGILFTLSTVMLGVVLGGNNLLTPELGWISLLAVAPAIVGMVVGQQLRKLLSEQMFRKVFFLSLLVLGLYIIASAARRLM